jgi:hypothetical protein
MHLVINSLVWKVFYFTGKHKGKRSPDRSRRRWKDNIEMDLLYVTWDGVDWINLAPDRNLPRDFVNTAMNAYYTKSGEFVGLLGVLLGSQGEHCTGAVGGKCCFQ